MHRDVEGDKDYSRAKTLFREGVRDPRYLFPAADVGRNAIEKYLKSLISLALGESSAADFISPRSLTALGEELAKRNSAFVLSKAITPSETFH